MNIFISWSKRIGLEYALRTKELLENISPKPKVFVSEKDITAGEIVQSKIIQNIEECDKLILCFTKETKKSPWLLFEAGYAKGLKKKVIPFLFDNDPDWHSWLDNPLNAAREINFNSESFTDIFIHGLDINDTKLNRDKIIKYKREISAIREKSKVIDPLCEDFVDKLISSKAFAFENPIFSNKGAHFFAGFESYDLYKAITESFLYTGKYLWIYGRKNMKLFGGSFYDLFKYLDEKSYANDNMEGIDFRCLFLNPKSNEVRRAHSNQKIFKKELCATLSRAKDIIGDNKRFEECFRLYSNKREAVIIRIDNCIIYSRPMFDVNGVPQLLTNTSFEVFSADSIRGKECIQTFESVWHQSESFR